MKEYPKKLKRDFNNSDSNNRIFEAYQQVMMNESENVEYHSLKKDKPFKYKNKWYTRDELKKIGLDKEASKAIKSTLRIYD